MKQYKNANIANFVWLRKNTNQTIKNHLDVD